MRWNRKVAGAMAMAMALTCLLNMKAWAQDTALSFSTEAHYETWSVWSDSSWGHERRNTDTSVTSSNPAMVYRMAYIGQEFESIAEYETAETVFPTMGLSKRQRFSLLFKDRGQGAVTEGAYVGFRYYHVDFAHPTGAMRDNDNFEITMGYSYHINPVAPGPYFSIKVDSPTIFWLVLIGASTGQDNESTVVMDETTLPLGMELYADVGFRFSQLPLDLGIGYRLLYYNGYSTAADSTRNYNISASGLTNGVFLRMKLDLPLHRRVDVRQRGM
ncbi:MAG: hypothetical protein OEZ28_10560 [Nitrospinota bacterium]|nr:hypothetical protein [Nitrospinota bacterium]